jgi:hypothetical protein
MLSEIIDGKDKEIKHQELLIKFLKQQIRDGNQEIFKLLGQVHQLRSMIDDNKKVEGRK